MRGVAGPACAVQPRYRCSAAGLSLLELPADLCVACSMRDAAKTSSIFALTSTTSSLHTAALPGEAPCKT